MSNIKTSNKTLELEKRRTRIEKEYKSAVSKFEEQKQLVTKKENDLKLIEAELVSALLLENGLDVSDLSKLLSKATQTVHESSTQAPDYQHTNEGG